MPDGATLIWPTDRRRRPDKVKPPSGIEGDDYQQIGDKKR
ncbi:hypothetical protein CKO_03097 [Citrobacter koseri ATCC BAA-895]|uniref:Uncharacterized protein n=1 Tax=Citrobacter koseri (strain ATCC BAA-895 / CDC 4225-83 / SGSC4696) TaxID=290338 RepID=A8AL26_CITK8|nr:hypothetical protein CKO_03097 [Citrobacter koseri ATCC BAA-895]